MAAMTPAQQSTWWQFFRGFLRSPRMVGSIAPSSTHLVRAMLDAAGIERRQVIAELGPGTGVFTVEIVRRMPPEARLLVFEIDANFAARLGREVRDPRATVIHASAADLDRRLAAHGLPAVDCVVSGLPFTSLPREVTHAILEVTRQSLAPSGVFVTYQYTPVMLPVLRKYFPSVRIARFVPRNLPPALVFVCAARPSS
jgi:phospholipid N-methyltransferase